MDRNLSNQLSVAEALAGCLGDKLTYQFSQLVNYTHVALFYRSSDSSTLNRSGGIVNGRSLIGQDYDNKHRPRSTCIYSDSNIHLIRLCVFGEREKGGGIYM